MFNKIYYKLSKYATGRNVIISFLITQTLYFIMLFVTIPLLTFYADGAEILDLRPLGYTAEYARTLFAKIGLYGREFYLYRQIPLDMIYPALFAVSYSLLLTYLFNKTFNKENKIHYLTVVPIFAGLFDYLENIGIIIMLSTFPSFSIALANITNIFSILKSLSTTVFFILLFTGIIAILIKRFKSKSLKA